MLSKQNRLKRREFEELLKKGSVFHGNIFVLRLAKAPRTESRFGFSVSKKAVPGAVRRNKLRRRGYAALETVFGKINPGLSGLFSLKKGSTEPGFDNIKEDVASLLKRSGSLGDSIE